ncbi:MAG: S8 family serine peptidase [Chloroflexota bacterium]
MVGLLLVAGLPAIPAAGDEGARVPVIVLARSGRLDEAAQRVVDAGGVLVRRLSILDEVTARIPATSLAALVADPSVAAVERDRPLHLLGSDDPALTAGAGTDLGLVARITGADEVWKDGITGRGVDVALIDSGVSPVAGLDDPGALVDGPDLSLDLQSGAPAWRDTFGHGTHLAGIIAGRGADGLRDAGSGVAPGARIVNVKVAGAGGQVDVSQVIAAIDWVVQHRSDGDLHIRVLALAFGTDGGRDYRTDPLARAVEVAWQHGIVVVVSAGNGGSAGLTDPAVDPFVIAVGADDPRGTERSDDDLVPAWSSRGDGVRNPDLVAPGVSIRSLRVPGSSLDAAVPAAPQDPGRISGSGTSQAAAVVAGAVALLLDARPGLTPDQVKALIVGSADQLPGQRSTTAGAGLLDVEGALEARAPAATQAWVPSTGAGPLEGARGSTHLAIDGVALTGEQDVFGAPWNGAAWVETSSAARAWQGGDWNGNPWAGTCWCAASATGLSWSGLSWSGLSWSTVDWAPR